MTVVFGVMSAVQKCERRVLAGADACCLQAQMFMRVMSKWAKGVGRNIV
jgi:hypothetical protein